jgi:hypothetical protein
MQKLFITLCFICTAFISFSKNPSDTTKYMYAELVGTSRLFSTKVTVVIDYGEEKGFFEDTRVRDEVTGKVAKFNSMVDALNYMGAKGWEFVQAYVVTIGNQNVYHWLLKKK